MSDILFKCDSCSKSLSISDSAIGKTFNCPTCENQVLVPTPDFNFSCPSCNAELCGCITDEPQEFTCPSCETILKVPVSETVSTSDSQSLTEFIQPAQTSAPLLSHEQFLEGNTCADTLMSSMHIDDLPDKLFFLGAKGLDNKFTLERFYDGDDKTKSFFRAWTDLANVGPFYVFECQGRRFTLVDKQMLFSDIMESSELPPRFMAINPITPIIIAVPYTPVSLPKDGIIDIYNAIEVSSILAIALSVTPTAINDLMLMSNNNPSYSPMTHAKFIYSQLSTEKIKDVVRWDFVGHILKFKIEQALLPLSLQSKIMEEIKQSPNHTIMGFLKLRIGEYSAYLRDAELKQEALQEEQKAKQAALAREQQEKQIALVREQQAKQIALVREQQAKQVALDNELKQKAIKAITDAIPPPVKCYRCNETSWLVSSISPSKVSVIYRCKFCNKEYIIKKENKPAKNIDGKREIISKEVQREVWQRDKGICVECGSNNKLEYDHIIPVALGGANTVRNIQLLCEECNRRKSAKPPGTH